MITYLILITTSILVGLAAMLLMRPASPKDRKAFLAASLLNAAVLLSIWLVRKRRRG